VITLGYKASAEQFGPGDLLRYALLAERVGLDSVAVSDHFQPFRHTGGHAPSALPWLGALAVQSERIRLGTSVSTPTMRLHPSMTAQAFATIGCLAPGRVWLGVGTGESLNEVPALGIEWPKFSERLGRLKEAVELIRLLWSQERVTYEGRYYKTLRATVYDRPDEPVPILVAAAGAKAAEFAGAAGDGYITTSGKPLELYTETLLPALERGATDAGKDPAAMERMLEVKLSYDHDRERAIAECEFWAVLALPAEDKQGIDDPLELERRAAQKHVRAESRFIVTGDPQEVADRVAPYVDLGFRHLVFHSPAEDQDRFLQLFSDEVAPVLRERFG
jgi:coenzyme F420-dependent glucose-6-phosphate dehydrogenase